MGERVWVGLSPVAAQGWACVVCDRSLRGAAAGVWVGVGRSHTGSQVFACAGACAQQATAQREVVAIPMEALTAGGAALLAALDRHARAPSSPGVVGGGVYGADPDELVAVTVQAAAPLLVAAELRRLADDLDRACQQVSPGAHARSLRASRSWIAVYLRARAGELDPAGGAV